MDGKTDGAPDAGPEQGIDQAVDQWNADQATPDLQPPVDTALADVTLLVDTSPAPDTGGPIGAPCGSAGQACQQGLFCVDGVCCNAPCSGVCMTCTLSGQVGACSAVPKAASKVCSQQCAGDSLTTSYCDGTGSCGLASAKQCGPTLCDPVLLDCPPGCVDHFDCISTSLCDRSAAHSTGYGTCVFPSQIAEVGSSAYPSITGAIAAVLTNSSLKYVLLRATTSAKYAVTKIELKGASDALIIVGDGLPSINTSVDNVNGSTVLVTAGTLTLQGVEVTHAATSGNGVICNSGALTIVESEIRDNTGVGVIVAPTCSLTLRRSQIVNNDGGGLDLAGGANGANSVVVNNLIFNNGSTTSAVGGIRLAWKAAPLPALYNNTIVSNQALTGTPAGMGCDTAAISGQVYPVVNTIVWYNVPKGTSSGCLFATSDVEGLTSMTSGNLNINPQLDSSYHLLNNSPCLDKGGAVPGTVIDGDNGPRLKGKGVDMGAYEAF